MISERQAHARPLAEERVSRSEGEVLPASEEPIEILLVDDRPENLLTLRAVLENPAYRLSTALSGEDALRFLLDHEPALILMDVQMPDMDGFETTSVIKRSARTREIPIIFITAMNKDERYVHQGYDFGAVDYIQKPFDPHILRAKVNVFAELARRTRRLVRMEQRLREQEKINRERRIAELEVKGLRRERAEQRKYRDLVEGIEHGIVWSADPDSLAVHFVSQSAERISGIALERWVAEPRFLIDRIPAEDRTIFLKAIAKAVDTGETCEVEHRFIGSGGRRIWLRTVFRLSARMSPDDGADGDLAELRGLSMDVSRIREADDLLRLSKGRSDFLAEASRLLGGSLDIELALSRVVKLLVPRFAEGMAIDVLRENSARLATESTMVRVADTVGEPHRFAPPTSVFPERTGVVRGIWQIPLNARNQTIGLLSILPLKGKDPLTDPPLDFGTAEDLGRRISAALDSANLYAQAQKAIATRDEFLSIASHELRTPLTPLKIQTQSLIRNLQPGSPGGLPADRIVRMLKISDRQLDRLSRLIDDLLDVSRISMGRLSLSPEKFDFSEMVRDIVERYCGSASVGGVSRDVEMVCPPELPVSLDRLRIEQVVVNLVTNALKYSQKGIVVRVEVNNEGLIFSVRDHGIGIAPKDQQRIFERFERATTGEHFGGLGLGLFIVGEIIRAHGGKVEVESELGDGAKFIVRLPLQVPEK